MPVFTLLFLAPLAALPACAVAARRELGVAPGWSAAIVGLGAGALTALFAALGLTLASAAFLAAIVVTCALIAETDRRHFLIPDLLSVTLLVLALLAPFAPDWRDQAIGAALAGALLLAVRQTMALLRGAEGMGLGDVKLAAVMGALLGPRDGLFAIAAAAFVTAALFRVTASALAVSAGARAAPFGVGLAAAVAAGAIVHAWSGP